ncbi:MAG: aspartate carbamoyltransferase catalytic subunit [Desulfobulbaceae bacterium]|jgi:aspartate carbamoyltransferase catalytic subunit|nr:aspartate carbamoyltransferase catalytic subunit [Desulfobulbaceae bacterium]HKJ13808.1 aspartate carbamoyltransferase catalytic subunit [Desulfobulbales bacterium]MDH3542153.1 aspartate carbamoyltransferase catalytic subunit [Desulfobulbaceae bacterium]MDH3775999.1 aspartate carbamoyltransferase catalytic subunit [Desulfobulbaceae bacterium]MDH3867138.1 aspartate carbamoyltransferase catalytic subunit [Desulfobulbaceae bacterium]
MSSEYLFAHKHILGLDHLSVPDIELILNTAESFKEISTRAIKKVPVLRGKTVVTLFFEPSTRTRLSFDIAAKRMSADTFSISASTSSTTKGETLADTARNIEAMMPDILIMRHPSSGACHYLAKHIRTSVINAGDGTHEHPSQGLLDLMTVKEHKGEISGLKIAIIGDISHSRVAHSDIIGFSKMGAHVFVSGPATLIPKKIERLGATVCTTMAEAVSDADVVMPLRIQTERQNDPLIPSFREYATFFGINRQVLQTARPGALLMHPGPINRGVELAPDVADSAQSVILDQVTNGVAIRMALMYLVLGGK